MAARRGSARRVELRPAARADIVECTVYLVEEAGREIAERFLDAVDSTLETLASMPEIGSARALASPRLRGLRQWAVKGFPNYLVFYVPTTTSVSIVRILHAGRDRAGILSDE